MSGELSPDAPSDETAPSGSASVSRAIPIRWASKEIIAALAWTLAADILIFRLAKQLAKHPELTESLGGAARRDLAHQRFVDYAMQWY